MEQIHQKLIEPGTRPANSRGQKNNSLGLKKHSGSQKLFRFKNIEYYMTRIGRKEGRKECHIYIIMFMYSQNHVIHMSTFMFTHAHIFRYLMCTYFFPKETLQPTKHLEPNLKNPKPSLKNPKANPRP